MCKMTEGEKLARTVRHAIYFIAGYTAVMTALGVLAAAIGYSYIRMWLCV